MKPPEGTPRPHDPRGLPGRGLAALAAGLLLLVGCSEYPDPYTGICPAIEDLEVRDITATTARVLWKSDHLMVPYLEVLPEAGPELVVRGQERAITHDVLIEGLRPDMPYRVTLVKDIGGEGDFEDLPAPCGPDEHIGFRTRPINPPPNPTGTPVPDGENQVTPQIPPG